MDPEFAPSAVLLTGGAGFIGSHVARRLAARGQYRVIVLDKMDYCASAANLFPQDEGTGITLVKGDICSMDLVTHLIETEGVDTVLHFAAQTHVDNSFGNSLAFTTSNTLGTHALLEAARKTGRIKRFVNVSTDEVYGDTSVGAVKGLAEASPLEPTNPYSAAKAGAEMLCKAYATSYGLPIIITRGNNVYGPGQYPEKLVPKFLMLAAQGRPLPVHGDGSTIRSYLYIDDVVDAFERIVHAGRIGETYNIGTDEERSVLDVARDVAALFPTQAQGAQGAQGAQVEHVRDRAFNDRRYYIGSEKLRAELGWTQTVGWTEGLRRTAEWYAALGREGARAHWAAGDVGRALDPHPTWAV